MYNAQQPQLSVNATSMQDSHYTVTWPPEAAGENCILKLFECITSNQTQHSAPKNFYFDTKFSIFSKFPGKTKNDLSKIT